MQRAPEPGTLTHTQWLEAVFARQDAVHAHAQTLSCPECGTNQIQIMNRTGQGEPFQWRCRHCKHSFVSGQQ